MIKLLGEQVVSERKETHYKFNINGKEILVSKWSEYDEFGADGDVDIFKGKELLTEEEEEQVLTYIEEEIEK